MCVLHNKSLKTFFIVSFRMADFLSFQFVACLRFFSYKIVFFVTKISSNSSFHLSRIDFRYISYFQSSRLVVRVRKRWRSYLSYASPKSMFNKDCANSRLKLKRTVIWAFCLHKFGWYLN